MSWLLYLSGDGWGQPAGAGAGGHLRAYCRRSAAHVACGAHDGDLQVGWLDGSGEAAAAAGALAAGASAASGSAVGEGSVVGEGSAADVDAPVFLSSWLQIEATEAERAASGARWHARSALYLVNPATSSDTSSDTSPGTPLVAHGGGREYLTPPFGADSPAWLAASSGGGGECDGEGEDKGDDDGDADAAADAAVDADSNDDADDDGYADDDLGMSPAAFALALRAQLPCASQRAAFSGVETLPHPRQRVVEVAPAGGTLVLFDSVAVIHEVRHPSHPPYSFYLLTHSLYFATYLLTYTFHQVLPTDAGERVALAGWFHEAQQDFPEWYGDE